MDIECHGSDSSFASEWLIKYYGLIVKAM